MKLTLLCMALCSLLWLGCSSPKSQNNSEPSHETHTLDVPDPLPAQEQDLGALKATLEIGPSHPKLGDQVVLKLTVDAQPKVQVIMPPFGDALGRFAIVDYKSDHQTLPNGGERWIQRYTLDLPMSGKQRIPSILIEFIDRRENPQSQEIRELLLDELTLDVASVLPPNDQVQSLRPMKGKLPPLPKDLQPQSSEKNLTWMWVLLLSLTGLSSWGIYAYLHREKPAKPPWDEAWERLLALKSKGLPDPSDHKACDQWYVELTDLLRRYIEGRFGIRAPELTTEEFLHHAAEHPLLQAEHSLSLRHIFQRSDRVKFAGERPEPEDSQKILEMTRDFLEKTKPRPKGEGEEQP